MELRHRSEKSKTPGEYCDEGVGNEVCWRNLDKAPGTSWHLDRSLVRDSGDERGPKRGRALCAVESASRYLVMRLRAHRNLLMLAREFYDDFDFPPTAHPWSASCSTASLFVLLIIALFVWGGWKLISLM